jgi:uncharacterized membrane protein YedE/YeeE
MWSVFAARAPWYVAGPAIGLLIVGLLWVTNKPMGALGGYIELDEWAMRKRPDVGWRTVFVAGVIGGGLLSALLGAGWHPTIAYGSFDRVLGATVGLKAAVLLAAGLFMGVGGRMAGGCTSGHGLCGTSLGSPASFACTAIFMVTAIGCMFAIAWMFGA